MNVKLISNSKLSLVAMAGRTCWQSFGKGGCYPEPTDKISEDDKEFIERIVNKFKHASISEHLTYTFYISGVSRALLQELARHRMTSPSVKSTRYTLKELKEESQIDCSNFDEFNFYNSHDWSLAKKFVVEVEDLDIDIASCKALENLQRILKNGASNDKAKYCLPESYKTELTWTINARSLQNFIHLRSSKAALWEIRDLAKALFDCLPSDHQYLFENSLQDQ